MKKVALMCDSSADITKEEAEELGIHVLRMPIVIDGTPYVEEETIFGDDIVKALKEEKKVTTTQPSLGEMIQMWDTLLETHDEVFYLPLSRELSGTCRNAIQMAKEYNGKVTVVDSLYACYPVVKLLLAAKEMFEKGYEATEVKEKIEKESELYAILIPETLTTLKNGGRISPAAAALAGMFKIQPLLKVEQGAIDVYAKVRTLTKAYKEGLHAVLDDIDTDDYIWMVIHADNIEKAKELQKELANATNQEVEIRTFKSIIMSHTGPGTIGFGRIRKIKY